MSNAVMRKPSAAEIIKQIASTLGVEDTSKLNLALLLTAADEVDRNSAFAARVRNRYQLLPNSQAKSTLRANRELPRLTLLKHVEGFTFNAADTPNPYLINEAFGIKQLRELLDYLPLFKVKEASAIVEQRNPGTKPTNKSKKDAVIEYIVRYVANDGAVN